jgi:beta-lactamase regulating signal transducer with metallopeptidase domain
MSGMALTALDLLIRVTVLLSAGTCAALLLHRRSASLRHLVWSASLGGSLVLGVMVPWSPRIDLPLRGWPGAAGNAVVRAATPMSPDVTSTVSPLGTSRETFESSDWRRARSRSVPAWVLLWSGGTIVVLLWIAFGRLGLTLLTRRGQLLSSGTWRDMVDDTSVQLGINRTIAIYASEKVGAPMTWGIRNPVLLVPAESNTWSHALRRSVAAHEVAHVVRRDYLIQLMSTVACAVYWFHPLAWYAARRMRQVAERACDDQVLALGATGEEYAAHLIGVARVSRQLRLTGAVAIGMARPSTLEGRIVDVLDTGRTRSMPTKAVQRLVAMAASVTLLASATVRPVAASTAAELPPVVSDSIETEARATAEATEPVVMPSSKVAPTSPLATKQGVDSVIERSFAANPGGLLTLDLDAGGGVTVRGWDDDRVRVRALLGGVNWRDVDVEIDREGNGVSVRARFNRNRRNQSTSNHFEIMVPRRYDVRISSSGGELTMAGVEGRFTGNTGGGEFNLERLTGSARLSTGGGEIDVRDSDLSGTVSTGGGTVRISNVRGGLRGSSGSGPVIYGEASDRSSRSTTDISGVTINAGGSRITAGGANENRSLTGKLNITKAGGDIDLDVAPNGAFVRTGGGDVTVGRSAGLLEASTGGGDVTVGPVSGSAVVGTGAGDVRVIVDRARGDEQVIEVTSGTGRVVIELPSDFSGRLDLETAYTRTHEDKARIRSDWELERDPITGWDDRYGTPRRFIRARAVLGRGTGRVVVRTVNDEIEIRRR